jgi:hypothetical protein
MIARLIIAFLISLIGPAVGLADLEFNLGLRYDTFPGNLLVLVMQPGYQCVALLFRESARSESAGILLFPAASLFNVVFYTAAIYAGMSWISSGRRKDEVGKLNTVGEFSGK